MRHILIFLAVFLLYSPLFGQSEETCYVDADATKSEFDPTLLSNMSVSLISEFLKEVEPLPPVGIPMDACVYLIGAVKVKETTFVTFKGKNLNSFGNSKLSGPDGFQEAVLKALYRALEDKRKLICDAYGEFIEKCGGTVKKIPADKIVKIREKENEYDLLGKRIAMLDTRIEKLNSGTFIALTNPHSIENPKLEKDKTKGLFVAVGGAGTILTSPDGTTWTERTSASTSFGAKVILTDVTYGNGLFVTVGDFGSIFISSDGTTWAKINSGISDEIVLRGVTYGNGLFVTVGVLGTILTSPDGTTWTKRTFDASAVGAGTAPGHRISYGNGLFVTYGQGGRIHTSPDGITWTKRTCYFPCQNAEYDNQDLGGLTYGNGLFVAVGNNGIVLTSSDGTTWAKRNSGTSEDLGTLTYGNGIFLTISYDGNILISPDGTTWVERSYEKSYRHVSYPFAATYGNGTFVTAGHNGKILTSSDGTTWAERNSGTSTTLTGVICSQ